MVFIDCNLGAYNSGGSGSGGAVDTNKYYVGDVESVTITKALHEEYKKLKAPVQLLLDDLIAMFPDGDTIAMIDDPCKYASNALHNLNESLKEVMYGKSGCSQVTRGEENKKDQSSIIIIRLKNGEIERYDECSNIEWEDGDKYDEMEFTIHGRHNSIKVFHDLVSVIRVQW
jgi:hypothetical protein